MLLLIVIQFRHPEITGPYKGLLGNILNPMVYVANRGADNVDNFWKHYIWLVDVSKENDELHAYIDTLSLENSILSERLIQLENLNKLLGFRDAYNFNTIAANVIGRNVDGYMSYLIVDVGAKDGVQVNDPVVSSAGLVGRVSQAYGSTSQIVILYHHDSSVSVLNSRTRAVGMLKGDGHGGLYVDYYDRLDDAQIGDSLITSGMGQLYPKGIHVGTISQITAPVTGLFQRLDVNCAVDFYKLEQVLIVKHQKYGAE